MSAPPAASASREASPSDGGDSPSSWSDDFWMDQAADASAVSTELGEERIYGFESDFERVFQDFAEIVKSQQRLASEHEALEVGCKISAEKG